MTAAFRYLGKSWQGRWLPSSGGTILLHGDQTKFGVERTADMVDITAGSEEDKSYLASLKDKKMNYQKYDTAANGTALADALTEGTYGTIEWGPAGTAVGLPKFAVAAYVDSHKVEWPYEDKVMMDITFQGSGAWVSDYGAVW